MNKNAIKRINNAFWTILNNYSKLPPFYQFLENDEDYLFCAILNAGLNSLKKDEILDYKNSLNKRLNKLFNKVVLRLCLYEYAVDKVEAAKPAIDYLVKEHFAKAMESESLHPLEKEYYKYKLSLDYDEDFAELIDKICSVRDAKDSKELLGIVKKITDIYKLDFSFEKLLKVDLNYIGYEEKFENDILDLAMNENIFSAEFTFNTEQDKFSNEYKEEEKKKLRRENIKYNDEQFDIKKKFGDMIVSDDVLVSLENKYCKGVHKGCKLYFTDGELDGMEGENHLEELNEQIDFNKTSFINDRQMIDVQINKIVGNLKEFFNRREQFFKKNRGRLDAKRAYKGTHLSSPNIFRTRNIEVKKPFVCEILIDGSGSLEGNQSRVAELAYITSEAFNRSGVNTRVCAFSNYVNYTIFREYKSYSSDSNEPIKNYYATGMNRDSLAMALVKDSISRQAEEKLVIYINDGFPNDINIVGLRSKNKRKDYEGKFAYEQIKDAVLEYKKNGVRFISLYIGGEKRVKEASKVYGDAMIYLRNVGDIAGELIKKIDRMF